MAGATGKTIGTLRSELWKEIGPFLTRRIDLGLSPEERTKLAAVRNTPPSSVAGRRVASVNQLDGIKLIFEDGSWILVRESGTEPVARVYIEAKTEGDLDALARAGRELIA
jgi:phosphomannomutase